MKRDIWHFDEIQIGDEKNEKQLLPIVIPFNKIGCELAKLWRDAIKSNNIFDNSRLITAYCNGSNLYKKLVSSTVPTPLLTDHNFNHRNYASNTGERTYGSKRCFSNRCKASNFIVETNSISSSCNNRSFKLFSSFGCKTTNLVYLITCKNALSNT